MKEIMHVIYCAAIVLLIMNSKKHFHNLFLIKKKQRGGSVPLIPWPIASIFSSNEPEKALTNFLHL